MKGSNGQQSSKRENSSLNYYNRRNRTTIEYTHPISVTRDENKSNDFKFSPLRYFSPSSPISLLSKLRTSKFFIDARCRKPTCCTSRLRNEEFMCTANHREEPKRTSVRYIAVEQRKVAHFFELSNLSHCNIGYVCVGKMRNSRIAYDARVEVKFLEHG